MKNALLIGLLLLSMVSLTNGQQYKIVTTIESIVPMGLGRSRIIDGQDTTDYKNFTTKRSEGTDSDQGKISRSEAKIDRMEETKLLNFYSGVGINFQNVASNDVIITSKLNDMAKEGWKLIFVTSGVESDSGKGDGKGIFITRFIFLKE